MRIQSALAAAVLTCTTVAFAQSPPPEIKRKLVEMGADYGRAPDIYLEALKAAPNDGVLVKKDLAYGKDPRQLLDVYQPTGKTNAPVLVYVHGGGYTGGARDVDANVYGNVLTYFARNGMLGINAEYRLAPQARWPSGAEDVRGVVQWVKESAKDYGGDPSRIFLMGHSAGASHVGAYVFDRRLQPQTGHGVAGAILVSGRYSLQYDPDNPGFAGGVSQYFGSDPAQYPSRSIISHVATSRIPVMLAISQFDQQNLVATTGELFVALCNRDGGRCPRLVQLKYHNHLSEVRHFNTADDYFGKEILEWIGSVTGGR